MSSILPFDTSYSPRRLLFLIALVGFSILCLGSLTPFQFTGLDSERLALALSEVLRKGFAVRSHVDLGVNVTVMIPSAFAVCGLLCLSGSAAPRAIWVFLALLICVSMSVSVEVAQLFTLKRVPSLGDVAAQFLGALLGAGLWLVYGLQLLDLLKPSSTLTRAIPPSVRASKLWIACLVAYSLLPYDLTLRPADLVAKWKSGKIAFIPFASAHPSLAEAIYAYATDIVVWIPLGFVAFYRYGGRFRWGVLFCLAFVSGVELLQLIVISRSTDLGDVLLGLVGALSGFWLGSRSRIVPRKFGTSHSLSRHSLLIWALVVAYSICLVFAYTYPWTFSANPLEFKRAVSTLISQPFGARYTGNVLAGLFDVVRTTVLYAVLGGALSIAVQRTGSGAVDRLGGLLAFMVSLAVACLIQGLRLFLPDKGTDMSDAVIAVVAGLGGYFVGRMFLGSTAVLHTKGRSLLNTASDRQVALNSSYSVALPLRRPRSSHDLVWGVPSRFFVGTLLLTLAIAGGLATVISLPLTPYNVKELLGGGAALIVLPLASLLSVLAMMLPYITVSRFGVQNRVRVRTTVTATVVTVFGAWLVAYTLVPQESLYDILGSPVWKGTPEFLELGWRFFGFFLPVTYAAFWAATHFLVPGGIERTQGTGGRLAMMYFCLVLPLSYFIVVLQASTDNIVELLPNDGLSSRVALWGFYPLLLVFSAYFLAHRAQLRLANVALSVVVIFLTAVAGYQLAYYGFAFIVVKYGRVFTPLQFLLSPSRGEWMDTVLLPWVFMGVQTCALVVFSISLKVASLWNPKRT